MLCPCCGREMKCGYIQCRSEIWWSEKKRVFASSTLTSGEIISLTDSYDLLRGAFASAYCCNRCKKIIVDYAR